jgi:hypothetical protein
VENDDEGSAALIVERLAAVATGGGSLLDAAEQVTTVPRRTPAVLGAARRLAAEVEDPVVRAQVRQFLYLLVDSGLIGADRGR